jgi:Zn-dependent protease with chaperone function
MLASVVVDRLLPLSLGLSLVFLLVPRLRALYLERRYRLRAVAEEDLPALAGIQRFLSWQAPSISIKANLVRSNLVCFIYPSGGRKMTLAIFGGLVKLWHADRVAAKAVLLHEIGHQRQGDHLILGVGSFFEAALKTIILAFIAVFFYSLALGIFLAPAIAYSSFQMFAFPLCISFNTFAPVVLPVACIWATELNADRFAIKSQGSARGLHRAMSLLAMRHSGGLRWAPLLTHPPVAVRQWFARRSSAKWQACGLLLFTSAFLLEIGSFVIADYLGQRGLNPNFHPAHGFWGFLWAASFSRLLGLVPDLAVVATTLTFWPAAASWWEQFFSGRRREVTDHRYDRIYAVGALVAWSVFVFFFWMSRPLPPGH